MDERLAELVYEGIDDPQRIAELSSEFGLNAVQKAGEALIAEALITSYQLDRLYNESEMSERVWVDAWSNPGKRDWLHYMPEGTVKNPSDKENRFFGLKREIETEMAKEALEHPTLRRSTLETIAKDHVKGTCVSCGGALGEDSQYCERCLRQLDANPEWLDNLRDSFEDAFEPDEEEPVGILSDAMRFSAEENPVWVEKWDIPSSSDPDKSYVVSKSTEGSFGCSCPVWKFRREECKHIRQVKEKLGGAVRATSKPKTPAMRRGHPRGSPDIEELEAEKAEILSRITMTPTTRTLAERGGTPGHTRVEGRCWCGNKIKAGEVVCGRCKLLGITNPSMYRKALETGMGAPDLLVNPKFVDWKKQQPIIDKFIEAFNERMKEYPGEVKMAFVKASEDVASLITTAEDYKGKEPGYPSGLAEGAEENPSFKEIVAGLTRGSGFEERTGEPVGKCQICGEPLYIYQDLKGNQYHQDCWNNCSRGMPTAVRT